MKDLVNKIAKTVQEENKVKIDFMVGTMIELPRAAIKAKDIAKHAEFFSFGTNDLTQTTFGISRDDSGKFLNDYIDNKIFDIDPFVSIDEGVEDLIEIAVLKGKKQNKKIKLGICGEHGGDPKSIAFCSSKPDPAISKRVESASLITNVNVSDAGANGPQTPTADNTSAHANRPLMIQPPP